MTIPAPIDVPFPPGPRGDQQGGLSRPRRVLRRSRHRLPQGDPRLLRRRLPLSAARRHRLGDDVRSEGARAVEGARRRSRHAAEAIYARVTNAALDGKPADMTITMHSCRGNFRSTFIASGGYEFVAEQLLGAHQSRRLFPRIRHRARRRLRAAALPAEGQEAAGARPRHLEDAASWRSKDDDQAPHRRGDEIRRARPALPVAAMRLRLDRGRQRAGRGRAVGEAAHDRGTGRGGVGRRMSSAERSAAVPRRPCRQPAALRAAEGGARQARARRDHAPSSSRRSRTARSRTIIKKQEDIGLQVHHRRRIPPRLLELRFPRRARTASRPISASARSSSRARSRSR